MSAGDRGEVVWVLFRAFVHISEFVYFFRFFSAVVVVLDHGAPFLSVLLFLLQFLTIYFGPLPKKRPVHII